MKERIAFFVIILLANIIQGVTSFAGTILAMPFSLMLVGIDTAVPVLNFLGLLSGIYIFIQSRKDVEWRELGRILRVMTPMIFVGLFLKSYLARFDHAIYIALGVLVILIAVVGLHKSDIFNPVPKMSFLQNGILGTGSKMSFLHAEHAKGIFEYLLLVASGVVHGMFVCGGPLLVSYLTGRIKDNKAFRATISTVWIFLNGIMFITHIVTGKWTKPTIITGAAAIPFLLAGMFIGSLLFKRMSKKAFMILTYVLLLISGISLLVK